MTEDVLVESIKNRNNETHNVSIREKKVGILQTLTNMLVTHKNLSGNTDITSKIEKEINNLLDNF
jgi:hypothetical protein